MSVCACALDFKCKRMRPRSTVHYYNQNFKILNQTKFILLTQSEDYLNPHIRAQLIKSNGTCRSDIRLKVSVVYWATYLENTRRLFGPNSLIDFASTCTHKHTSESGSVQTYKGYYTANRIGSRLTRLLGSYVNQVLALESCRVSEVITF
jgi:hypothetical protein